MFHPTVRDVLSQTAAKYPDRDGVVDPAAGESLTFGDWDGRVSCVANGLLNAGLTPGDRLAVVMKDCIELPTLVFAAAEAGIVLTPVDYRSSVGRLEYVLDHSGAAALVYDNYVTETVADVDDDDRPDVLFGPDTSGLDPRPVDTLYEGSAISPEVPVDDDETALLLYTSGTTGRPKGVLHTHRNVVEANLIAVPYNRLRPDDVSLALGPLYHVGPLLANFLPALHMGATNVVQRDFDPETTLDYIEDLGVSAMWGVPTHFNDIINHGSVAGRDISSVRMIQYSGDAMPREVVVECREQFEDVDFVNAYGTTEIILACFIHPEHHDDHLGSIGRAIPNTETRLIDPENPVPSAAVDRGETGEILVRTPTLMEGYWQDPERTDEAVVDGWYRTGDLARRDEDGFVYFIDRKDNMIVSGGENIYPAEVEDVVHEHPAVAAVAVTGTSHEKWGQAVTAFVVPDGDSLTEDDLEEYCLSHPDLDDFKRPRRYRFVDELPKTESGKIARADLPDEWG